MGIEIRDASTETIDTRGSEQELAGLRELCAEEVVLKYQELLLQPEFADRSAFTLGQIAEEQVLAETPQRTITMGSDAEYIRRVYGEMVLARCNEMKMTATYAGTPLRTLAEIAEQDLCNENQDKIGTLDEVPFRG